jgi:N-acyl-D-aspartate/D-glutamate deacylase
MEGKTLKEISAELKKDVLDFIIELLIEERLRVGAIFHSISEENLRRFLREPWIMIGTDSSSRSFNGPTRKGKPHPRGFGSMPRFLGYYVRDKGLLSLEEAIKRLTYLPAKTFGLKERGIIKNGAFADIVIFDPERIVDRADFSNPFLKPDGIRYVFVNGLPAIREGEPTGIRNGAILRNGR